MTNLLPHGVAPQPIGVKQSLHGNTLMEPAHRTVAERGVSGGGLVLVGDRIMVVGEAGEHRLEVRARRGCDILLDETIRKRTVFDDAFSVSLSDQFTDLVGPAM